MEDLAIEMMGRAMIAQIEPHDVEAVREQQAAERQHVGRLGAAFPAVQQNRDQVPSACATFAQFDKQFGTGTTPLIKRQVEQEKTRLRCS